MVKRKSSCGADQGSFETCKPFCRAFVRGARRVNSWIVFGSVKDDTIRDSQENTRTKSLVSAVFSGFEQLDQHCWHLLNDCVSMSSRLKLLLADTSHVTPNVIRIQVTRDK